MTPRKNAQAEVNPILSIRIPPEMMRQLDALAKFYGMNRTQVILMAIAKEYVRIDGQPKASWE